MNGETATSRARADDPVLMTTRAMEGYPRYAINPELQTFMEQLRLHFWNEGNEPLEVMLIIYGREA